MVHYLFERKKWVGARKKSEESNVIKQPLLTISEEHVCFLVRKTY